MLSAISTKIWITFRNRDLELLIDGTERAVGKQLSRDLSGGFVKLSKGLLKRNLSYLPVSELK